jgi:hypothetical protein
MRATEHILLESDAREVPQLRTARKVHSRLRIRSRLPLRAIELTLLDYHYLSVRTWQSRRTVSQYVLDLRFVDPGLRLSRHVAWRWMTASVVLATLAIAIAWWTTSWKHDWLALPGGLSGLAACSALIGIYRTTQTLALLSVNGRARLLTFTGRLGTVRAVRRFSQQLAAHVRISVAARRSSRAEHLRDEMREHFRLKEAGVLSEQEYEVSKGRILGRHSARIPPRSDAAN